MKAIFPACKGSGCHSGRKACPHPQKCQFPTRCDAQAVIMAILWGVLILSGCVLWAGASQFLG
jgi:hypothetical protein